MPSDADLVAVRDGWSTAQWDAHVRTFQGLPAGRARYDRAGGLNSYKNPNNDVVKYALFQLSKGRCWWQGGACRSRVVPPRDAQIDHIVPKTSNGAQLREALLLVSSQKIYFDVHDPANLAYICGPCNQSKSDKFPSNPAEQDEVRNGELRRADVIKLVDKWYANVGVDVSGLGLRDMDISDAYVREMYADLIAQMVVNLAVTSDPGASLANWQDVEAESSSWTFHVSPTDESIEAEAESRAENEAADRRAELWYEES